MRAARALRVCFLTHITPPERVKTHSGAPGDIVDRPKISALKKTLLTRPWPGPENRVKPGKFSTARKFSSPSSTNEGRTLSKTLLRTK